MKKRLKTKEMLERERLSNEARIKNGFDPFPINPYMRGEWDEGYCMSSGCTCDSETAPKCGLFQKFDESRVKKDFVWKMTGWETSSSEPDRCEYE